MLKTSIHCLEKSSIYNKIGFALSPLMHPMLFSSVTDRENNQTPYLISQVVARTLAQMEVPHLDFHTREVSSTGFFEKCDFIAKTATLEPKVYIGQDVLQSILTYLYAKILEQVKEHADSIRLNQLLEEFLEMTARPHFQEVLAVTKSLNILVDCKASDNSSEKVIQDLQSFATSFRMSLKSQELQDLVSLNCKVMPYSSSSEVVFPITHRSGNSFIGDANECRKLLSGRISYPSIKAMPTSIIRQLLENPYLNFDTDNDLNCFLKDLENLNKISEDQIEEITNGIRGSMRFSRGLHAITEVHQVDSPLTSKLKDLSSRTRGGICGVGPLPLLPKFLKYEDVETRDDSFDPGNFRVNGYLSSIEEFEKLHTEHGILCHGTSDSRNVLSILKNGFVKSCEDHGTGDFGSGAYTTKDIDAAVNFCKNEDKTISPIVFFEIKKSKKIRILDLQSSKVPKRFIKKLQQEAISEDADLNELLANKYSIDIIIPNNDQQNVIFADSTVIALEKPRPVVLIQNNAIVVFPKNNEECLAKEIKYFEKKLTCFDRVKASEFSIFSRFAQQATQIQSFKSQVENLKKSLSNDFKTNPKTTLDMVSQNGKLLEYVPKDISNYTEIALAAVKQHGRALEFAFKDIPNYSEIALTAVKQYGQALEFVSKNTPNYFEIALAAVKQNSNALRFVPKDTPNYSEIALAAVKNIIWALQFVSKDISNYKEIALAAVKQNGKALEFASKDILNDFEIALTAVKQDGMALQFVSENTPNYFEIGLTAVKQNSKALQFVSKDIPNYFEIVLTALKENITDLKSSSKDIHNNSQIALAIVKEKGWLLKYVPKDFSNYSEIALAAVNQYGRNLKFASKDIPNYSEIALSAVKQCGMALDFVSEDTPNYGQIALTAVKQNGIALQFVPKDIPNYEQIALAAVKQNGMSLRFVPKTIPNYFGIALTAVIQDEQDLEFVIKDIANYSKIALDVVKQDGLFLEYVPKDFSNYSEIALAAVNQNGQALEFVPKESPNYNEITLAAVIQNGRCLKFVPKNISNYSEIALAAVKQYGELLRFIPKDTANYSEIALTAVKQYGDLLEFVPQNTPNYFNIALAAVKQNGMALKSIPKKTPNYTELALAAVKENRSAFQFVPKNTPNYNKIRIYRSFKRRDVSLFLDDIIPTIYRKMVLLILKISDKNT